MKQVLTLIVGVVFVSLCIAALPPPNNLLANSQHLNMEARAILARISGLEGWLLGLGRLGPAAAKLDNHQLNASGVSFSTPISYPASLDWWKNMYGDHLPACFEFDLTVQWGYKWVAPEDHRTRVFSLASEFHKLGGLPWFRDHVKRLRAAKKPSTSRRMAGGEPIQIADVLPGGKDHLEFVVYYTDLAKRVRAFKKPAVFRPFHEMNGRWFWWGGKAAQFKILWRAVFDIFQAEGAHNVIWCWSVSASAARRDVKMINQYYPGDDVVDILALDYYSVSSDFPGFFNALLSELDDIGKGRPIFLGEFGIVSTEQLYARLPVLLAKHRGVKGLMLWWGRGWKSWRKAGPDAGSMVDHKSTPAVRRTFIDFLKHESTITLYRWNHFTEEPDEARGSGN